jgi:transcriptional regulator with XRE-family HTH domain
LTQKALARRTGFSVQHISEAELAKAPVSTRFIAACDEALDARGRLLALLLAMVYERAMQREQRAEARRSDTTSPPGVPRAVRSTQPQAEDDDDVKRRTFLGVGLAALLPPSVAAADGVRRVLGPDIEEWERTVHAYGYDVALTPTRELVPAMAGDLRELQSLLDAPLSDADRQALVRVAGQLATLTAGAVVGAGKPEVARRWWRHARQAATASGDAELLAFACGSQAVLGLYGAYTPTQVLAIADEAQAATKTPCPGVMQALGGRAQALALLGRERESMAALDDLARTFERLPDATTRDRVSAWGYSEQKWRHAESYVGMCVGGRRGEQARERALELYPAQAWKGPAQVRLHRAASLIADGDVTEGARYATRALEPLSAAQRADRFVARIADRTLAVIPDRARDMPAVRELREALTAA